MPTAVMYQRIRAIPPDVLFRGCPGLLRGNEHSISHRAMKPIFGVGFAGPDQGVDLIAMRPVVFAAPAAKRRWTASTSPVQAAKGFADGKEFALFTLHAFPSTRSSSQIRSRIKTARPPDDLRAQYRLFYRESESARRHSWSHLTQKRADP